MEKLAALLISLLLVSVAEAGRELPVLKRCQFKTINSGPNKNTSNVKQLVTDSNGFVWVLQSNTVSWYDGRTLHPVPTGSGIHEIPSTKIAQIVESPEKQLWFCYPGGISVYSPTTHSFRHVALAEFTSNSPKCIGFNSTEIVYYNGTELIFLNRKIATVSRRKPFSGLIINQARNLYTNHFFYTNGGVIYRYPLESNQVEQVNLPLALDAGRIIVLPNDRFLHVTETALHIYDRNGQFIQKAEYPNAAKSKAYYNYNWFIVHKLAGVVSFFLENEIWEFDTESNRFVQQLVSQSNQNFISNGHYTEAAYDKAGNLVANSNLYGIIQVKLNSHPIKLFAANDTKGDFVKCFCVNKSENRVLVGSYGKGLFIYDTLGNMLKNLLVASDSVDINIITNITRVGPNQYIAFKFRQPDFYLINTKSLSARKLSTHYSRSFLANYYGQLHLLRTNQFWYSNNGVQIFKINLQKNTVVQTKNEEIKTLENLQNGYPLKSIVVEPLGPTRFIKSMAIQAGVPLDELQTICKWQQWWMVGTTNGLLQFDEQGQFKKRITSNHGLADNYIHTLLIDDLNNLWCSHNSGISKIDLAGNITNLNSTDGLQSDEFNYGAAFKTTDGELFFGGTKGLNSFYPKKLQESKDSASLKIVSFTNMNHRIDTAAWNIHAYTIPFNQNRLNIQFVAQGQHFPEQYQYQYRIAGINNAWVSLGNQGELNTALPFGNHTLEFWAGKTFESEAFPMAAIQVHVQAPWYLSWWFLTLSGITTITLIWMIAQFTNKRKYKRKLLVLQMKEQVEQERNRISRDLHDNIGAYTTALLSNIDQLSKQQQSPVILQKIHNNAEQILASLRDTIWVLNNKEINLDTFIDNYKSYCVKLIRNFEEIDFEAVENIHPNYRLPSVIAIHLQKILQEAFQNALKHSHASAIRLTTDTKNGIEIQLTDNGIGFDTNTRSVGNGLENMQWRAAQVGIKLLIESSPTVGTKVQIGINSSQLSIV